MKTLIILLALLIGVANSNAQVKIKVEASLGTTRGGVLHNQNNFRTILNNGYLENIKTHTALYKYVLIWKGTLLTHLLH